MFSKVFIKLLQSLSASGFNFTCGLFFERNKNRAMELVGTFGTYLCFAAIAVWILWRYNMPRDRLGYLPGPRGIPMFGNTFQMDSLKVRLNFHQWAKQYGGVYRLRLPVGDMVVISDYRHMRECLINTGGNFAGRVLMYYGDRPRVV